MRKLYAREMSAASIIPLADGVGQCVLHTKKLKDQAALEVDPWRLWGEVQLDEVRSYEFVEIGDRRLPHAEHRAVMYMLISMHDLPTYRPGNYLALQEAKMISMT